MNSRSPTNGATGISTSTTVTLTFDENINRGTGNIIIRNRNVIADSTLDVTSTSDVTISNNVASFTPSLDAGTLYSIIVPNTAFSSVANNEFFVGLLTENDYTFTTTGTNIPTIATFNPQNSSSVATPTSVILTFNQVVEATPAGGTITIINDSDETSETINSTTVPINIANNAASITITPTTAFVNSKQYQIQIDGQSFRSLALQNFAGLGANVYTFDTQGSGVPSIVLATRSPANDAVNVSTSITSFSFSFDEVVTASSGVIRLIEANRNITHVQYTASDTGNVQVSGKSVTVNNLGQLSGRVYFVQITNNAFLNLVGNSLVGFEPDYSSATWKWNTDGDFSATLDSTTPANDTQISPSTTTFILTFSQYMQDGTTGSIHFYNFIDEVTTSIPFNDASVSHSQFNTTISGLSLIAGRLYIVKLDNGFVQNLDGFAFDGGWSDNSTLRFTTSGKNIILFLFYFILFLFYFYFVFYFIFILYFILFCKKVVLLQLLLIYHQVEVHQVLVLVQLKLV